MSDVETRWELQVSYALPTNPDLLPEARSLEADALNERTMVLQTCTNPDTQVSCENDAELAFREKISSIPGVSFVAGYVRPSGETVSLFELTSEQAADPKLNPVFSQLGPNSWAPLGVGLYDFRTANFGVYDYGPTPTFSVNPPSGQGVDKYPALDRRVDDFPALAWAVYVVIRVNDGGDPTEGLCALARYSAPSTQQAAEALLGLGASVNGTGKDGLTPLRQCVAVAYPNAALASYLLDHGAKVDARDSDGATALSAVMNQAGNTHSDDVMQDFIELATALLKHGADANARDARKMTPLSTLMQTEWRYLSETQIQLAGKLAELLIVNGADVNARGGGLGYTPLMQLVSMSGHSKPNHDPQLDIVKLLLSHGAEVKITTDYREAGHQTDTALSIAEQYGLKQCAKLLQDHSAASP